MIFRTIGMAISTSTYFNANYQPLPELTNDTDMSVPTGSGTINDPWVYNSLNTTDNSTATGTHDIGVGEFYIINVTVDSSSEVNDIGTVTFEYGVPFTPVSVGGNPNSQSLNGYIVQGVDITTKYVKDSSTSAGSDNATFTLGSCPVPTGNMLIDETNTTPHWKINNTLRDTPITWGTLSNPIAVNTIGNQNNSEQELYLIAQTSGTCFWDITVDSEVNDLGYLYLNGVVDSNFNGVGGASQNRTGSFAVSQNDVIRIRYSKDATTSANNDRLTVNSLYIN